MLPLPPDLDPIVAFPIPPCAPRQMPILCLSGKTFPREHPYQATLDRFPRSSTPGRTEEESQARAISRGTTSTPHCPTATLFPPDLSVTVLCRRKPHCPANAMEPASQPRLPPPLSPFPHARLFTSRVHRRVRQGRADIETNIASRSKVSGTCFPLLSAMTSHSACRFRDNKKGGDEVGTLGRHQFSLSLFSETRPPRKCDVCFRCPFFLGSSRTVVPHADLINQSDNPNGVINQPHNFCLSFGSLFCFC